ncbi:MULTISPECIES: sugar transferase [Streptococcus]|nr:MULTISPECIES: sugar transferase [unclassified Streptococcus]
MAIHITNLYGQSSRSVALMSQAMVADIGRSLGMKEIGIYYYNSSQESASSKASRFDGMNAALAHGDIVIFQTPIWHSVSFEKEYLQCIKRYNIKLAIFIHDVLPLMFEGNYYLMSQVIENYNMADVLIVPSQAMVDVLRENGLTVKKIIIQHMWDHTIPLSEEEPRFSQTVNFSGSPKRFSFIEDWKSNILLQIFTDEADQVDLSGANLQLNGWKSGTELLSQLARNGGFGLVWNQRDGRDYYQLNASYKLSTYLAAGLPVFVPTTLSNKEIIVKNGLGFAISSLDDIPAILESLTEETYTRMVQKVKEFRMLLNQGYFTKKVLVDTIHALFRSEDEVDLP